MEFTANLITYKGCYKTITTSKLNVPTTDGRRTVISNHMPIMMPLEIGVIEACENNKITQYAISEGMMMFENNEATILCDEILDVKEIDLERAKKAAEKAQKKLDNAHRESDILRAKIALRRATNLINIASDNND